jgi:glycerol-3-phosphate acyltransferase PlsY
MRPLICILIGYAIGCIQSAYIVGRMMHVDLRQHGSGNLGSTNALRVLGKKAGAITFLCDILKSVASFLICRAVFPDMGMLAGILGSTGAVLGHDFPFYLHFSGGKGIAAMIGMVFCLATYQPWVAVITFIVGILALVLTKYVSVGSMVFAVAIPIMLIVFQFPNTAIVITVGLSVLALFRHKANIQRLFSGNENKLGAKKVEKG